MMNAVIFRQHGGLEALELAEVPAPEPGPGQVRVRVRACSINHLDIWVRQGIPAYRIALPHISGSDVAGVVDQSGPGTSFAGGEPVIVSPGISCFRCRWCRSGQDNLCESYGIVGAKTDGGYAELMIANADDCLPLPSGIGFEEAAAFPLVFLTAWHMLITRAHLQPGETVLVQAAGSGVGHAAVQIAKLAGATVIATVGSQHKRQQAKALGADEVIEYQREDFLSRVNALTRDQGVDVVVEHIGPQTWEGSVKALAKGGRLVTCGATSGPSTTLDLRYLFSRQLNVLGSMMGTRAELLHLMSLVAKRKLKPVLDTIYPLREAKRAQQRMLDRDVFGKLVLFPDNAPSR
jgi:NADPH:quinone reductase-like Zn-dependent oxidoreductase